MKALNRENVNEALEYFNKEIGHNSKSGYTFSWEKLK